MENNTIKQSRWRSKYLWAAVVAQVLSILVLTGVINAGQSETVTTIVGSALQILTLLGVVNNPTDKVNW